MLASMSFPDPKRRKCGVRISPNLYSPVPSNRKAGLAQSSRRRLLTVYSEMTQELGGKPRGRVKKGSEGETHVTASKGLLCTCPGEGKLN